MTSYKKISEPGLAKAKKAEPVVAWKILLQEEKEMKFREIALPKVVEVIRLPAKEIDSGEWRRGYLSEDNNQVGGKNTHLE